MALRPVMNKAKFWSWGSGYHRVKGKFGSLDGAVAGVTYSPIVGQDFLFNGRRLPVYLNHSCRRHYFLPLPPPVRVVKNLYYNGGVIPVSSDSASVRAEFALLTHNQIENQSIRFVRVVRASCSGTVFSTYYITLEGIDENGELNVYYAIVLDSPLDRMMQLIHCQLVDESFSYDFEELRWTEHPQEQDLQDHKVAKNHIMREWLWGMEDQSGDDKTFFESNLFPFKENPDLFRKILDFEENFLRAVDFCPPWDQKDDIDSLPTDASDAIVPVFDVAAYENARNIALFAVGTHNSKKGDKLRLQEVLCASKLAVDRGVLYSLLLGASDKKKNLKFYCAIVEVFMHKKELVKFMHEKELLKWHLVDEFFFDSIHKDQVASLKPHGKRLHKQPGDILEELRGKAFRQKKKKKKKRGKAWSEEMIETAQAVHAKQ